MNQLRPSSANIVLVGFMCTGKTAVGQKLAVRLHREFVDMDQVIEEREGRDIPTIFRESGEPYFRTLERALVQELAARESLVIATGGGVVLNPANIEDFRRTGVVICLTAPPDVILQRVGHDPHRPLLQAEDRAARIRALLDARRPFYEAIEDRVDTRDRTPEQVAEEVLRIFLSRTGHSRETPPGSF